MAVRIADLGQKWTKECKSVDEIRDLMVLEQFLRTLTLEIKLLVKPTKVSEAAQLADQLVCTSSKAGNVKV